MRWLSYRLFTLRGWRFVGTAPEIRKFVTIAAPHTSNWDFFLFLAAIYRWDLPARFLGKHTLFRWPFGWMFRKAGGIPVDRSQPGGIVAQVKQSFDTEDEMVLVVTPEGTRKAAPSWKSGFVEIASHAEVPVVFAGVNAEDKTITLGEPVTVGDDRGAFMDQVRSFYAPMNGIRPDGEGPIRLKEESVTS